ncbi:SH3 domain-containing protein [Bacillus sp. UMB0893]|uniref:SH3 domain-containing protein n=1 Tax=Bacillus sp. UMB0893 TaxID=2066053 RepID=UPI000C790F4C|nr:N-acetylglucosaminidase [Bacillus sp. UMB0893]PLR67959.1 hypothetical protein CYJ36_11630 [Bacillus sp. UMB0893]
MKKFCISLVAALFLIASLPLSNISAQSNEEYQLFSLREKTNLETASGETISLEQGAIFYSLNNDQGKKTISFQGETLLVDSDFLEIAVDEQNGIEFVKEDQTSIIKEISLEQDTTIYDNGENLKPIAVFPKGLKVQIYDEDETSYKFLLGNRGVHLLKKDLNETIDNKNEVISSEDPEIDTEKPQQPIGSEIIEEEAESIEEATKQSEQNETNLESANQSINKVQGQMEESIISKEPLNQVPSSSAVMSALTAEKSIRDFTSADNFFKVDNNLPIYDNRSGALVKIGNLTKGQIYKRIGEISNWHKISVGNFTGYIHKSGTEPAVNNLTNINNSKNSSIIIKVKTITPIYDNSNGMVKFANFVPGVSIPIIGEHGNWYSVDVGGRVGYIYKTNVTRDFTPGDQFFRADSNLPIYDNRSGALVKIGNLTDGQVYKRTGELSNWHKITVGNFTGYINKSGTEPAVNDLTNINTGKNTNIIVKVKSVTPVYDNSKGMTKFANLVPGVELPILGEHGNWYSVDVGGRVGYIYKPSVTREFTSQDQFFKANDNLPIYDNRTGALIKVGNLTEGQVYKRVGELSNWHKIVFGEITAFIHKGGTEPASNTLTNLNPGKENTDVIVRVKSITPVYDNSTGMTKFANIEPGVSLPVIGELNNWYSIDIGSRIGYVHKGNVETGKVIHQNTTIYDYSLSYMLDKQMSVKPQTDLYKGRIAYISADDEYVDTNTNIGFPREGIISASALNIRDGKTITSHIYGQLKAGAKVNLLGLENGWYKIALPYDWYNAKREDVEKYVNPANFDLNSTQALQFLLLSKSSNVYENELNLILKGKGILDNKGSSFAQASSKYQINEIYLISHALLETGNGSSELANGIIVDTVNGQKVTPKKVYNMYGVSAFDDCAVRCGSEYAYQQGWDTPEKAIIGGAAFVAEEYIHNNKDTLYKMRWNPANPGTSQYATDIGWAYKQVNNMSKLYGMINNYTLYYDVPVFK